MLPKAGRRFFYAVARGRETGVFATWDQCSKVVNGFAGAKYKKFDDRGAAEAFARGDGGATTSAPTRKKQQPKRTAFAPPAGVLAVYTDGGCRGNVAVDTNRTQPAGWGFVAVRDGHVLAERWGPVELARGAAGYLGAEKCSNNTGELSAIGEALLWLRDEDRGAARALICYDSKYAANITDGTYRAHKNVDLARTCQSLFAAERSRRAGGVALQHVKGHSGDAFNDRADALRADAKRARGRRTPPSAAPPMDDGMRATIAAKRAGALARKQRRAEERARRRRRPARGSRGAASTSRGP
ncbi:Ribonuclease H1 [Aureococcus anophagefferens]|uniref:ribonuclease H n=2 Tax=Aureococcus anophagefferens TaxID=44056 RepID=A0ABR1G3R8_AURAN